LSWIEDNLDDLIISDFLNMDMITSKLNNEKNIEKLYNKLEENYTILVCNILESFKNGKILSDKQKYCLAKYINENDLEEILED
jgi:hypothetical protein